MIKLIQGFDIGSPLPIDGRILLSRSEMEKCCTKGSDEYNTMPDRYFTICEEDGLLYLFKKNYEEGVDVGATFEKAVPENTSQLVNDGNGDLNSEGLADPFDTIASVDSKISALDKKVSDNFIDNDDLTTALNPYSKTVNTGNKIEINYRESDYSFTIRLLNSEGTLLAETERVDLPVESLVMNVEYDQDSKEILIFLQNDPDHLHPTRVPIGSLIYGLVNEDTFTAHTGNTTIHTNASEKTA